MSKDVREHSQDGSLSFEGVQKHMATGYVSCIWPLTKKGDESCQEGDDHVVHQSDAEAGKEIALAEA